MKVLVTGGSGFLGINLIRYLLKKGIEDIVSLDIADFSYPEREKVKAIRGDVRDREAVRSALKNVKWVIHAAAALPLYSPEEIYSTEVEGTETMLEESFNCGVERFVYISSTAVYGIPDHYPVREDDALVGVGPYGKAKIEAERACVRYRNKGMCIPIIRPKSFIGPERLGVFAIFYEWAKDGKNFPLPGNGKNYYQLLDVEDLCEAIYLCLTLDKETVNDVYNVGAKEFSTMKEDYQAVLDYAGFGKKIIPLPAFPSIVALRLLELMHLSPLYKWIYQTVTKNSVVSIEKAEKKLGLKPRFSNQDALLRNFKWYLANYTKFEKKTGISHTVPWNQKILRFLKFFF